MHNLVKNYHDFMDKSNTTDEGSFYWPVAPGDSWHPNIQLWKDPADPHPRFWTSRDLIHIMARPVRTGKHNQGGEILYWYISIWGGDDHSVTTREASRNPPQLCGHRLTLQEIKNILLGFPNPLSVDYINSLQINGRPLFIRD